MDLVTPEAVALDLREATIGTRSLAYLVDLLVQAVAVLAVVLAGLALDAGAVFDAQPVLAAVTVALLTFALLWGYPVAFETLMRGRTPGKAALGLRVVTREGAPEQLRHAAIRAAFLLVDVYLTSAVVGVLFMIFGRRHQRLGDLIAGTIVLRERVARSRPLSEGVGGFDDQLLAGIDASGVRAEDTQAAAAFLQRAERMEPHARRRLAVALADRLRERTAATPPEGMSAERFVALVLTATRRTASGSAAGVRESDRAQTRSSPEQAPGGLREEPERDTGFAPPA